jgi:hypothetical protein
MCFACRITKATDQHPEYVIIAFYFSMAISCMSVLCLYIHSKSYWLCEFSALIKFSVDPATGSKSAHQAWLESRSMIFLAFCSRFGRDSFKTLAKSLRIHTSSLIWDLTTEVLCRANKMVGTLTENSIYKVGRTETYIK